MEEIVRLQKNLLLIRRAVGWSAGQFGNQIGVTRQTINNIENGRNKLTKTQYIAMRSVLDAEIVKYPEETKMLKILLEVTVDHPENYSESYKKELIERANLICPAINAGTATREEVSNEWIKYATQGAMAVGLIAGGIIGFLEQSSTNTISSWLQRVIKSSK